VEIDSPDTDIISGTLQLSESFLDAASLLRERCAARTRGSTNTFVVRGRGGIAPGPETSLYSSVLELEGEAAPSVEEAIPETRLPTGILWSAGLTWETGGCSPDRVSL
jgi:hypothetical protein